MPICPIGAAFFVRRLIHAATSTTILRSTATQIGGECDIRVCSIIGRLLEHSRVFYFANGGDMEIWAGSADWMNRNLRGRVEVVFPIEDPDLKQRLYRELLELALADRVKARQLQEKQQET